MSGIFFKSNFKFQKKIYKKEKHKKGKLRVCQKWQDEALQDVLHIFKVNALDMKSSHHSTFSFRSLCSSNYMTWYIVVKNYRQFFYLLVGAFKYFII